MRGFFIRVTQIEFRMAALSLYDIGSLVQFSRLAPESGQAFLHPSGVGSYDVDPGWA
jgi:hypothetical protein